MSELIKSEEEITDLVKQSHIEAGRKGGLKGGRVKSQAKKDAAKKRVAKQMRINGKFGPKVEYIAIFSKDGETYMQKGDRIAKMPKMPEFIYVFNKEFPEGKKVKNPKYIHPRDQRGHFF